MTLLVRPREVPAPPTFSPPHPQNSRSPLLLSTILNHQTTEAQSNKMAPITLYFLQSSRSIRTAWLLEELSLDYDLKFFDRQTNYLASKEARAAVGTPMGKFPTIKDGDEVIMESGAITQYVEYHRSPMIKSSKSRVLKSFPDIFAKNTTSPRASSHLTQPHGSKFWNGCTRPKQRLCCTVSPSCTRAGTT